MNPLISIACDVTFGAGSENFGTVTGNVIFQDGSANSGTVNGNATFEGNAIHRSGAVVTGNAAFSATAVNNGTVSGTVTIDGGGNTDESDYQAWRGGQDGVGQYSGAGSHNNQWVYWHAEYASEAAAQAAYEADYQAWLAANTGVNQYNSPTGSGYVAGTRGGQWAYNGTEYSSQSEAQAAYDADHQ